MISVNMASASSRTFSQRLNVALLLITVVFIFSLTILPPKPVEGFGKYYLSRKLGELREEKRKMVLGSRPPGCVNKCLNCRPCRATLVIPSHQKKNTSLRSTATTITTSSHREDDSYYLLSWKCRCGNKLYQP